jgi:DNA-directed RNA polymerase specialized sigma subunit
MDDEWPIKRRDDHHRRNTELARLRDAAPDRTARAVAQARLAAANAALGRMWARRYSSVLPNLTIQELVDIANEEILTAAGTWDPDRGASFSNWSSFLIRSRLQREVTKLYGARLARVAHAVRDARVAVECRLSRVATLDEVAEEVGLQVARVAAIERAVRTIRAAAAARSLDATTPGTNRSLHDVVDVGSVTADARTDSVVELQAVAALSPRHQRLARMLLQRGDTPLPEYVPQVADVLQVSVQDVLDELDALGAALREADVA